MIDYQPYFKNHDVLPIDVKNNPLDRQSWGHFLTWVLKFTLATLIVYLMIKIAIDYPTRLTAYNRHVCGVYGYQDDCKTKLELTGSD